MAKSLSHSADDPKVVLSVVSPDKLLNCISCIWLPFMMGSQMQQKRSQPDGKPHGLPAQLL
jgi:hypothetical protein